MSLRDGGVNRQHSVETGLTQAIRPMLICASESSVSVRNQQVGLIFVICIYNLYKLIA